MPNWCSSDYTFVGDKGEIETLYRKMRTLEEMKEPLVKNGFGNTWLGCLVKALEQDYKDIDCRGEWSLLELKDGVLTFTTETAWRPAYGVIDLICERFPSIRHYYCAEETGCGVYETNDKERKYHQPEKYYYNAHNSKGEIDSGYVNELQYALDGVNEVMGCKAKSIEEVENLNLELLHRKDDSRCCILELKVV